MGKVKQTNKYKHNKTSKIIWESIYPLKVLVVREDCGWIDRERGKYKLGREIKKGRLQTEKQVIGLSYDDYREGR
jgi:hypothetical protein